MKWLVGPTPETVRSEGGKYKLPIPIIDDLLDELCEAIVFSKIDLYADYHQIRVREEDVYKSVFRTYRRYFEYKVMPFGFTNTHTTFQALMSHVFKVYL